MTKLGRPKNIESFNNEKVRDAAEVLGSQDKLARILEVTTSAVFNWCRGKYMPSPENCLKIEKATNGKVKARDIRPDFDFDAYIEELKSII